MPAMGIVIPLYNAEAYIGQAIESIITQSVDNWFLVVIDDGSSDHSLEIASQYASRDSRIRVFQHQNAGVANTRNRGIELLPDDAQYVMLLDHDDCLQPHALEVLSAALDAMPQAPAVYGFYNEIDSAGAMVCADPAYLFGYARRKLIGRRLVRTELTAPTDFATLANANCIVTPGQALIRRQALLKVGGFDQKVAPSDDWDAYLRLSTIGYLSRIDRVVINKRTHANNVSHLSDFVRSQLAVRYKLVRSPLLTKEQRQLIRHGYVYFGLKQIYWVKAELLRRNYHNAWHMFRDTARVYAHYLRYSR